MIEPWRVKKQNDETVFDAIYPRLTTHCPLILVLFYFVLQYRIEQISLMIDLIFAWGDLDSPLL